MIGLCSELMASRSVEIQFTHFAYSHRTRSREQRRARSGAGWGAQPSPPDTDRLHHVAQGQQLRGRYVPCEGGAFCAFLCTSRPRRSTGTCERRDALEALDARTWVDVAERSEFRTAVRRTAASSQASFTFHKHRMHTPTSLMHGSRPQAAWPCACTRSPTLRSLGRHSFIGTHN
jgi:hypothetical protein